MLVLWRCVVAAWRNGRSAPIRQTIDNDGGPAIPRFGVSRAGEMPAPNKCLHPSFARQILSTSKWPGHPLFAFDRVDAHVVSELPKGIGILRLRSGFALVLYDAETCSRAANLRACNTLQAHVIRTRQMDQDALWQRRWGWPLQTDTRVQLSKFFFVIVK